MKFIKNGAANSRYRVADKITVLQSAIVTCRREQAGHRNIFKLIDFKIARQLSLYTTHKWPDQRPSPLQETFEILFIVKGNSVLLILDAAGASFPKKYCTHNL